MTELERVVKAFAQAWAARDLDAVMAFFVDDCRYSASVGPEPGTTYRGRTEVRAGIEAMFRYDQGSTVGQGRMLSDGERVFAEWTYDYPAEDGRPRVHGCDVFDFEGIRIRSKEAFRKQLAPAPQATTPQGPRGRHEAYVPRRFDTAETWAFEAKRFKLITIGRDLSRVPYEGKTPVVDAPKRHCEALLPHMDALGGHFDLGYVILHEGEAANWLLFDWWIEGGIACHLLSRSDHARPTTFERVTQPLLACVWEMLAITHEREAWVRWMMTGSPDPEAYLADLLLPGER